MPESTTPLPETPPFKRAWVASGLFVLQCAVLDVLLRGTQSFGRYTAPAMLLSALFWALVLAACGRRWQRVAVAGLLSLLITVHVAVHRLYHVPLNVQVLESALASLVDVGKVLRANAGLLALGFGIVAAAQWTLLELGAPAGAHLRDRALGTWAKRATLAGVLAALLLLVPASESTFDMGSRSLLRARTPHLASGLGAVAVAPMVPRPGASKSVTPSVLLIISESIRAKDHCQAASGPCPAAPYTHALLKDRVLLPELRSVSSYTMISLWALLTGRAPAAEKETLGGAPTLFELVRAGRFEQKPTVRYLSVQARDVLYRQAVLSVLDQSATLESWVGEGIKDEEDFLERGVDRLLAARCEADLPAEHGPTVTLLHFAGTHAPYFVAPDHAPFAPWGHVASWGTLDSLHNAYKNSILDQDQGIERCIRAFQRGQGTRPYVILFTSDHGEAFGEHSAIHHGQNLYDEQIHVPAYIATFNGALSNTQEAALRQHAAERHTHLDLLPTILDTLGLLGAVGAGPIEGKLSGRSLLRDQNAAWPVPVSNCTAIFPCPISTWGMLSETQLLTAQPWDDRFHCTKLGEAATPDDTGPGCDALRKASVAYFPKLPSGKENR